MNKFKVGDRVMAVTDGGYDNINPGMTGTVSSTSGDLSVVTWDTCPNKLNMWSHEIELIESGLEARVAALEKLVGTVKAPEYSFGDRVEVLVDGGWVEGLIAAPRDDENGTRWCSFLYPKTSDGGSSWWFEPHEIRPRK